jgi:hypothetical protein
MAIALPPDSTELEKQEYARWLDSAISQLRTAEMEETYDNLQGILTSKAYSDLSISQGNGGYPSPSGFMKLAPELRMRKLSVLVRSADELEESTIAFLDNLAESEPDRALALIGDLSRGGMSGDFKAQLSKAAAIAKRAQAEALHPSPKPDFAALKDVPELLGDAPSIIPDAPRPSRPSSDPRDRPEDRIKNADRIMRKLVGGEEAGG